MQPEGTSQGFPLTAIKAQLLSFELPQRWLSIWGGTFASQPFYTAGCGRMQVLCCSALARHSTCKRCCAWSDKNRGYRRKAHLLLQQGSDPSGEMEMSKIQKQENLGYQSCPDKHASSNALNYAQIQRLQGREKSLFFLQKAKCPPVIRQRKCRFLSEFSISKECSVTEFVDGKHQGREDGPGCYGLPGFFESARVIKFQRSQPAERPKERSCV